METTKRIPSLNIGNYSAKYPIIQGGMGVGVSRYRLAGAMAKAGGIGIISTAQIGFDEPVWAKHPIETNLCAIHKHIHAAKLIATGEASLANEVIAQPIESTSDFSAYEAISHENYPGLVGVNIMVATKYYDRYVLAACEAGADVIISGAGLPMDLPQLVGSYPTKIAPIVSSAKAANLILKMWNKKYKRTADFIVIEGPHAGGHLGFSTDQLDQIATINYDEEIKAIISVVKEYEAIFNTTIPVVVAGGIYNTDDIHHMLTLGAQAVQIATPFVVTEECDASSEYKQAYINARKEDVRIVISPVGMPARAIQNRFLDRINDNREAISSCHQCLTKCNPKETPYCITRALINAVTGNLDEGLIFCGSDVEQLHEMTTVPALIANLIGT